MNLELHINNRLIKSEACNYYLAPAKAQQWRQEYLIDQLRQVGVSVMICLTEVPSQMNIGALGKVELADCVDIY